MYFNSSRVAPTFGDHRIERLTNDGWFETIVRLRSEVTARYGTLVVEDLRYVARQELD